jgi:hypothetical protein
MEVETLRLSSMGTEELTEDGDAEAGFRCLLAGLHRAEEAEEDGEPWGAELVAAWREACEAYAERHGIGRA